MVYRRPHKVSLLLEEGGRVKAFKNGSCFKILDIYPTLILSVILQELRACVQLLWSINLTFQISAMIHPIQIEADILAANPKRPQLIMPASRKINIT